MLTQQDGWISIAEVNPPDLPDLTHRQLDGQWKHVLITDNVFGKIRVSPYAYAARITHDVPRVHPTVVVSTRDRNILAIESEVRGALGNGVDSFLVVIGDTMPAVEHHADHLDIVEHLRKLQAVTPPFEVGMPTRFSREMFRRRVDLGSQFFIVGPVIDPSRVAENVERLGLRAGDPPVFLGVMPPFSSEWIQRAEGFGAVPSTEELKARVEKAPAAERRALAWELARETATEAREAGCSGVVVMGLRFSTVVDEGNREWNGSTA
ncbi:MAG: hypothetical protein ACE5MI_14755 [Acidimicrobiia bacterium]